KKEANWISGCPRSKIPLASTEEATLQPDHLRRLATVKESTSEKRGSTREPRQMGRERRQISRATYRTESRPAKAPGPACGTCRSRPLPRRNINRTSSAPTAPVKAPNTAPAPAETTSPSRDMNHQAAKRMVATRTTCSTDWDRAVGIMF